MQNICAEMEKWFFLHFSNRSNCVGNEANFTHGNLKLLRETLVDVICGYTVCVYTQTFCVLVQCMHKGQPGRGPRKSRVT